MADKYPAFKRNDLHKVSRPLLYLLAPLTFIRFAIGWGSIACLWAWVKLWTIGLDSRAPIPEWKRKIIRAGCTASARTVILMMSGIHINEPKLNIDYSAYLGPDWKPSWKNPGTVISNHSSFIDIMCHMYRQEPSHVSKAGVLNIPFVGKIASGCGCLFIDRAKKEERKGLLEHIAERQAQCE